MGIHVLIITPRMELFSFNSIVLLSDIRRKHSDSQEQGVINNKTVNTVKHNKYISVTFQMQKIPFNPKLEKRTVFSTKEGTLADLRIKRKFDNLLTKTRLSVFLKGPRSRTSDNLMKNVGIPERG